MKRWTMAGVAAAALMVGGARAQNTDVGTPRKETLIVDILTGRVGNPHQMNPYQEGAIVTQGLHQVAYSNLWEIDTVKGTQYPDLAATMPEALDETNTRWRFKVRKGLTWSDGVPFTATDVVFTAEMVKGNPKLSLSGLLANTIKSITASDDETVEVETTRPLPKIGYTFGVVIFGNAFRVMPKHVWEKVDPARFENYPPVTISAYTLKDTDPNGTWFLWERRVDWQQTDVGQIAGQPAPRYVLFRSYGPEERRVIAMAQNDMDVLTDVTPESLDILRNQNPKVRAWFDAFPYANLDDPCERGISFNNMVPPYDKWQTRWALALAMRIGDAAISTYSGMLRVSPLHAPPTAILTKTYQQPMAEWLTGFALPDGYKPFDPDYAAQMGKRLNEEGVEGLPKDEPGLRALFGVGWWRYDPAEATRLLESVGFKKQGAGWLKPDGTPWKLTIAAPADFELESQRLAFAVANEWKKFGVDVNVQQQQGGVFQTEYAAGHFEAGSYWNQTCGIGPDLWVRLEWWNQRYVQPLNTPSAFNRERYTDPKASAIIDEMGKYRSDDPKNVELGTELLKQLVTGMPVIPMFGTAKFVPVNTTYWTNFPTATNYYEGPWWWWSNFKFTLAKLKPAQ